MSKLFEPGFEAQVFGPDGVERLREAIGARKSVKAFMLETEGRMARAPLLRNILSLAENVEPEDRSVGILDEEVNGAHSFLNGARVALGGLLLMTTSQQRQLLGTVTFKIPPIEEGDDTLAIGHEIASEIMEAGRRGFSVAEAYHDLFERIEHEVSPEVKYSIYARAGFGIPFYMLSSAMYVADMSEIKAEVSKLESGEKIEDWDKGLEELLGS